MIRKFVIVVLILQVCFLFFRGLVNAETYFYDSFSGDFSNWYLDNFGYSYNTNGVLDTYGWYLQSGKLVGEAGYEEWSFLYPRLDRRLSDYILEARVENVNGVDLPIYFRVSDSKSDYYQLAYRFYDPHWPDSNNVTLWKSSNGNWDRLALKTGINISKGVEHDIKVIVNGPKITAYFDGNVVLDYTDLNNPLLSGGFGLKNWGGSFDTFMFGKVKNIFDYMWVGSLDDNYTSAILSPTMSLSLTPSPIETPTPTPTPQPTSTYVPTNTPTPEPTNTPIPTNTTVPTATPTPRKRVIIVLPGLGASWNTAAVVGNVKLPNDQWQLLPFVHNYDGLVQSLKNAGIETYLWPYDWRGNIDGMAEELDKFINKTVVSGDRVDLVGHSLGGLVARMWWQKHQDDPKVNKIVTIGSPHQGTIKAYEAWASGQVPADWGWKGMVLNVLSQTQKQYYPNVASMVRGVIPVLRDINPTFDFLAKNGDIVPWKSTNGANLYLSSMNEQLSGINLDNVGTMVAIGSQTKRGVVVDDPSIVDKMLQRWPDGKPKTYKYEDGDGTVLEVSAELSNRLIGKVSAPHADMVDPAIPYVFDYLGLPTNEVALSESSDVDGRKVYFIGSPAYLEVKCDGKPPMVSDKFGFVLVSDWKNKHCFPVVVGIGSGTYHLVEGVVGDDDSWKYTEGEVVSGRRIDYSLSVSGYEIIIRDLKLLQAKYKNNSWLKTAVYMASIKQPELLLESVFGFRRSTNEYLITDRILQTIEDLLAQKYSKSGHVLAGTLLKANDVNRTRLNKYVVSRRNMSVFEANSKDKFDIGSASLNGLYQDGSYSLLVARQMILTGTMLEVY